MQEKNRFFFIYSKRELRLVRVFLITTAPSSNPVVDFFLLTASVSVKEKLTLPFFTHDYSGPKSRMMTSSCRNKRIQLSGKQNTRNIFKRHLVTRLHAFCP